MKSDIKFTKEISLIHLNPLNYALKNDYMSNLFSTGLLVLPVLGSAIKYPMFVKKAMISRKVLFSTKPPSILELKLQDKFAEGLALSVGWDGFDIHEAIDASRSVINNADENVIVVVNDTDKYVSFYRDTNESAIYEIAFDQPENYRMIQRF